MKRGGYDAGVTDWIQFDAELIACRRCPRLVQHCQHIAQEKRRAYQDWEYWARPVPSFGPPTARLLIVGLAPGAHGSNRTGQMFTGDASGVVLFRALYRAGFASQPATASRHDGMQLIDCRITAILHCAPPGNKPTAEEIKNCSYFFDREIAALPNVRGVVALGQMAFDGYLQALKRLGRPIPSPRPQFAHGALFDMGDTQPWLLASYHPSQQNTFTGRLTQAMLDEIFLTARERLFRQDGQD
ncbi:MAG: uracil-DNA glycosylase [Abditibacteriales bacterium]|nr:uracil-DNA glycosylase [Abditibacteriales bacterium]MDW8366243.1 uracil-DNA glycosylase [Abditibacteriales bacterium]